MTKKDRNHINEVQHGRIDFYYPIKIETKKNIDEILDSIERSPFVVNDEFFAKMQVRNTEETKKMASYIHQQFVKEGLPFRRRELAEVDEKKIEPTSVSEINSKQVIFGISETGGLTIHVNNATQVIVEDQLRRRKQWQEYVDRIYGAAFSNSYAHYLINPFEIELVNGSKEYMTCELYCFANKILILKLQVPFTNLESCTIKEGGELENIVRKITDPNEVLLNGSCSSVYEVAKKICDEIRNQFDEEVYLKLYRRIWNLILSEFDNMPHDADVISGEIKEELYKMVCAPVSDLGITNYKDDAKKYFNEFECPLHNTRYLVKSTGGCLSYVDDKLRVFYIERTYKKLMKEDKKLSNIDSESLNYLMRLLADNIALNCEFAILMTLLEKTMYADVINKKQFNLESHDSIEKEYDENRIFLTEIVEDTYGTVYEQAQFFRNKMYIYMKKREAEEKLDAINSLRLRETEKSKEAYKDFLSIMGFTISLVFGLPAIYNTIIVLRTSMSFFVLDVPYLRIDTLSIFIWAATNFFIFIRLIRYNGNTLKRRN